MKKIDNMYLLRTLFCVGVVLSHVPFTITGSLGAWGVSGFFILSGFLMTYNYYGGGRICECSIKNCFKFAISKIRPLYPLYIITTIFMLVFCFTGDVKENVMFILTKVVLNILLLQEWFPLEGRSINAVAWYLSVATFLYFMFPIILKRFRNGWSRKKAAFSIVILYVIQILVGRIGSVLPSNYDGLNYIEPNLMRWMICCFPLVRLIEFLIGCNLSYLFLTKQSSSLKNEKLKVFVSVFLVLVSNGIYLIVKSISVNKYGTFFSPMGWWLPSVLFA